MKKWLVAVAWLCSATALAQTDGGLYYAGNQFSFTQAVERGLAQNPGPGARFFVVAVPPEALGLSQVAPKQLATLRMRAQAAGAQFYVCQRDIDAGTVTVSDLVPGVVAVRGWPPAGSNELPAGSRYFADEDPAKLPASTTVLRRLREICTVVDSQPRRVPTRVL
jgi:intracellular sulfur oxidation DsrE/DsrF family protein